MMRDILLFGRLRGAFGDEPLRLPEGVRTAAELRRRLQQDHPEIAERLSPSAMKIAVNQTLVSDEDAALLSPGDEVALLPPLSGG
jgi:molybdopterin converting factor subunit 1